MTKRFTVAMINSTNTIIVAKPLWKKVGGYYYLNCDIYHYPRFKQCTIGKSIKKEEEAVANAA